MSDIYAQPRTVAGVSECDFYHVMDLPDVGTVGGEWDLRQTVHDYLGRFPFQGKRVLDVGAASGFLTFEECLLVCAPCARKQGTGILRRRVSPAS